MGNASSVGIGDTVRLVISLSNLGPKLCDAKLNYKIPVGLKLLSSQGPGFYDPVSGVWDAGLVLVNDSVSLDLVLQAVNIGYFVNMVSVYGDLTSTHASVVNPIFKVFNGKWRSTAAMPDSNSGNNIASYILDVRNQFGVGDSQNFDYKWPDDVPPVPKPKPEPQPPTPNPPEPPKPNPQPNSRLGQDILNVREAVSTETQSDTSKSTTESNQFDATDSLKFYFEWLLMLDDIQTVLYFLGLIGVIIVWGEFALPALMAALIFAIGFVLVLYCLYLLYSHPKSS